DIEAGKAPHGERHADRRLAVLRYLERRTRDKDRRHDGRQDRERVDAGIEYAEAAWLPDPGLARMPAPYVLLPDDVDMADLLAFQPLARGLDGRREARMPGGEERDALFARKLGQRLHLAHRRPRRLFEQHVPAGAYRCHGHVVAWK